VTNRNSGQVQGQIWRSNTKFNFPGKLNLVFDLHIWPWTWPLFRLVIGTQLIYYNPNQGSKIFILKTINESNKSTFVRNQICDDFVDQQMLIFLLICWNLGHLSDREHNDAWICPWIFQILSQKCVKFIILNKSIRMKAKRFI